MIPKIPVLYVLPTKPTQLDQKLNFKYKQNSVLFGIGET